jgi:hypothetical protein
MAACGGISFDGQQSQGFKNCYLKTSVNTGGLLAKVGTDSAIVAVDNGAAAASPIASSSTIASLPISTTTTAADSSSNIPTSIATVPLEEATMTASPLPSIVMTTPIPDQTPAPTSSAWIAAPVIGGLAALTLILAVFILWGRRRRGQGRPFGFLGRQNDPDLPRGRALFSGGEKLNDEEVRIGTAISSNRRLSSAMSGSSGTLTRNGTAGFKVLSGSGRRVGHESRTKGTGPGLEGIGNGVGSKAGLRDSQNGLRLNGVSSGFVESVPGIPEGFAGPASLEKE